MRSDAVKTYGVTNVDLGAAGTINAVELPGSTYQFAAQARGADEIRIHPNPHIAGTFFTVKPGTVHREQRLHLGTGTGANGRKRILYVSSPAANAVVEVLTWE